MLTKVREMNLHVDKNTMIAEIKRDFEVHFPALKIEFSFDGKEPFHPFSSFHHSFPFIPVDEICPLCPDCGVDIEDKMTIGEVENLFLEQLHLPVKIFVQKDGYWQKDTTTGRLVLGQILAHPN